MSRTQPPSTGQSALHLVFLCLLPLPPQGSWLHTSSAQVNSGQVSCVVVATTVPACLLSTHSGRTSFCLARLGWARGFLQGHRTEGWGVGKNRIDFP